MKLCKRMWCVNIEEINELYEIYLKYYNIFLIKWLKFSDKWLRFVNCKVKWYLIRLGLGVIF